MAGRIMAVHRDAFLELIKETEPKATAAKLKKATTALQKELVRYFANRWPVKDMKVLARYNKATKKESIKAFNPERSWDAESIPLTPPRLLPDDMYRIEGTGLAAAAMHKAITRFFEARDEHKAACAELRGSIRTAIAPLITPNTTMRNLDEVLNAWPDKRAKKLVADIKADAGLLPPGHTKSQKAREAVAAEYGKKAA